MPARQTVNKQFYLSVLKQLRKRICRVRPELVDIWILHHDNAPLHTAFIIQEFLANHGVATLPQPPYSPDLAPPDFFLLPRIKRSLKGRHLGTFEGIKSVSTQYLKDLPLSAFQDAFLEWKKRYQKCIDARRGIFWGILNVCTVIGNKNSEKKFFSILLRQTL